MTTKIKKSASCPTEDYEQIKFATWLDKNKITYYAIPNGGYRNPLEAIKLKRCGTKSGVPDICIPIPILPTSLGFKGHHGLYIELKRVSGGVVSENQKIWIEKLRKLGYWVKVARGCEEAKEIVKDYLSGYDWSALIA